MAPPGSIPNPEVKHTSADGSVGSPHVRVGHRQTSNKQSLVRKHGGFFYACSPDARRPHTTYVAHPARQSTPPRAPKAHATTASRTSRILRDNPHRPVRPHDGTTAPCTSRILRDNPYRPVRRMRTLRPRHVRRALCATIHIAPCAQGARYARVTYVAHPARQSISRRAQNAHATSAPCTSRIVRDNPHRAVRPRRTLQINRTLSPKMATFISIYLYYYSDVMQ